MRGRNSQGGVSMLEVLVTLVIVSIGLLGLAQLQSKLQVSEIESYQRAQALVLLKDMASRIAANRTSAASYVTDVTPLGVGMTCPTLNAASTRQQIDSAQWCRSLQGAAERSGTTDAGAMIGARGCVTDLGGAAYLVTIAWQGMIPISAPPVGVQCGVGAYDGAAASCSADRCRRVVTTVVRIATLI